MMITRRGQSILEYTMLVAILTVVLYYMGTGIKRGVQSLVKVTADQIGNQQNADQDFNDVQAGWMVGSNSQTEDVNNKQTTESGYINKTGEVVYSMNASFNESSNTVTNSASNGGFAPAGPS